MGVTLGNMAVRIEVNEKKPVASGDLKKTTRRREQNNF